MEVADEERQREGDDQSDMDEDRRPTAREGHIAIICP